MKKLLFTMFLVFWFAMLHIQHQHNIEFKKETARELETLRRIDSLYNAKDENIWK